MDACNWSQDRFNEIKDEFVKMLQMIGYKPKKVPFIPYSGFNGDNLVDKVDPAKCSWYKGWSAGYKPKKVPFIPYSGFNGDNLVDKVDPAKCSWYKGWSANQVPKKKVTGFSIVDCLNNFIIPPKRLPDAPLRLPVSNIYTIEQHKKVLDEAGPGNSVGLSIKGIAKDEKVNPGDIIYNEKDGDLKPIKSFTALVAVQEHPGVLKP